MRILALLVVIMMLCFAIPTSLITAQGPTATPTEQMYSRASLLTQIAPKPFVRNTPAFQEINLISDVGNTTIDGASWGLTFLQIFKEANVQVILLGILIALLLVYWLRKFLIEQLKKREVSPAEMQFRENYKKFRANTREYRQYRRSYRGRRR